MIFVGEFMARDCVLNETLGFNPYTYTRSSSGAPTYSQFPTSSNVRLDPNRPAEFADPDNTCVGTNVLVPVGRL